MSKGKVVVRHKVRDFDRWKPYFMSDVERQRKAGFTRWYLTRSKNDKSEIVVIFECEDLDKAKPMFSDPSLANLTYCRSLLLYRTILTPEEGRLESH